MPSFFRWRAFHCGFSSAVVAINFSLQRAVSSRPLVLSSPAMLLSKSLVSLRQSSTLLVAGFG